MTLEELGQQVIVAYKEQGLDYSHHPPKTVARRYLELFPERWELISPFAREYQDVLNRPSIHVRKKIGVFATDFDAEAEGVQAETRAKEIRNIKAAEDALEASSRGLSVEAWKEISVADVAHHHKITEMERASQLKIFEGQMERDTGLDGDQRIRQRHLWEASEARRRLKELHLERHETATSNKPEGLKQELLVDIDVEIARLRRVLNGLEGLVPDGPGQGLRLSTNSEGAGGSEEGPSLDT